MKLGAHMPDGERRKPIDNEVCRTKVGSFELGDNNSWRQQYSYTSIVHNTSTKKYTSIVLYNTRIRVFLSYFSIV
jgi:hypothetical protein